MVFAQENKTKHNIETKHQLSASTQNAGISKSSKSVQLLMQELAKTQTILQSHPTLYGVPKDENMISPGICNPPQLLYSAASENSISKPYNLKRFPETFNPRKELNMPHKEKVEKWIVGVPAVPVNDNCDAWQNACYNPLIPTSDEYEESDCSDFDFSGNDDIIEYQSRMITFLINKTYFKDSENVRKSDGKLVPGGMDYDVYLNEGLDYNDFHHLNQYEQYGSYNLHR